MMFTKDDLLNAIFDDSMSILSSFLPIPKESIKWFYDRMKKNPINQFLKIDNEAIQHFYKNDSLNLLELQFNNEREYLPQHVVIDNTIDQLDVSRFVFKFNENVFELSEGIKDQAGEAFKTLTKSIGFTNGENLRLWKLEYHNGMYTFYTQPVYYKTYLHTNMVMDYAKKGNQTLREQVHKDGKLDSFEESKLANHLGFNVLLFTPAGYLVLPLRSKKVSYAPSEFGASISGAVSANDVSDGKLIDKLSIIREGIEELGLKRTDIVHESISFLGLTRELIRGGKPELFFSMETTLTRDEIMSRWTNAEDKWENKSLQFYDFSENVLQPFKEKNEFKEFQEQVNNMFNKLGSKMSLPFATNLALWIKLKMNGY